MSGRTTFDWRLYTHVWEEVVEHGKSEYGESADEDGYLVRIIETAMREAIRENRHADLEEKVAALVDAAGVRKKDLDEDELDDAFEFDPTVFRDKTRVVKQVDADLLRRWKRHADESSYSYGVLLSKHLKYYLWGGQPRTLTERVDRVLDELESESGDDSDPRTKTEEIIAELEREDKDEQFTRGDFLEAAEATGVGTEKYALSEYLPKVLDAEQFSPHPENSELFIPRDSDYIPEMPDPGNLPYRAMDDSDKRLALKAAALRAADETWSDNAPFTVADAVDTLHGRPRYSTVRSLLRAIADDSGENGFVYDDDLPGLHVNAQRARAADHVNEDSLAVVGWLNTGTDTPEEPADDAVSAADDTAEKDWLDQAVELVEEFCEESGMAPRKVPENIIDNKISRAMRPDAPWDEDDAIANDLPDTNDLVDTEDRERVLAELTNSEPDTPTATIPREEADEGAEMDQLVAALRDEPDVMVTDGEFEQTESAEVET